MTTMRGRSRVVVVTIAAAGAVAGLFSVRFAVRSAPPTGLVVITLDTTRADRLSTYGFEDVSLPALERLAT